jgi:hypothetical protein
MIIPPTTPAIIPDKSGAPEANATPKHKGIATKKTTKPEDKFGLIDLKSIMIN